MAYVYRGRTIRKIGVIGSGQIGPDIALYFTKVLHAQGVAVVVIDVAPAALEKGKAKTAKKVQKGVETKAFAPDEAARMLENIQWTTDYSLAAGCDLVVEAATEDEALKGKIFKSLESLCPKEAILVSNSSHLEPEVIFAGLADRGRTGVVHYFFPAERNIVVEVVPGKETRPEVADWLMGFYEAIGKAPIRVRSRYGYAVDPVFEGLFQAAALCVEGGLGTTKEVDVVATRALGLGVGPFTAMNLTGGNPITNKGLDNYRAKIGPWFRSPDLMKRQLASGQPWETPGRGEAVAVDPAREKRIAGELVGAYLGICAEIVQSGIASVGDLEMAVEAALDMTPPFRLMNKLGPAESLRLVEAYAKGHPGFIVADILRKQAAAGRPWTIPTVFRADREGVAVVTIRRPRVLNALDGPAWEQIGAHLEEAGKDPKIRAVVLTGFGVKAFAAGADVTFLARIETPEQGEKTSLGSQAILNRIEAIGEKKPVVCALNGFAFGGGNELAMACTARIARKGLAVLAAQPEPNLGIIPGAGGTQRLPRLIGLEKAAELLRTCRPISSAEAVKAGLVSREAEGDLVDEAAAFARALADGKEKASPIRKAPLEKVPASLPSVEIGHLSRRIDAILCEAILGGARKTLAEGLAYEAKKFGECFATEDARIGIRNFTEKGPKSKAPFVHR